MILVADINTPKPCVECSDRISQIVEYNAKVAINSGGGRNGVSRIHGRSSSEKRGGVLTNASPLYQVLVQSLAFAKQFDEAEAVLRFVMQKRPSLVDSHFFITPITQMTNDRTSDQSERQARFLEIYERAMTAAEQSQGSNGMKFDEFWPVLSTLI